LSSESGSTLAQLTTEGMNPNTLDLSSMDALDLVRAMNAEDVRVAAAVGGEAPQIAHAVMEIAARLRQGGRLVYVGAGTSGRLGVLDAAECPPTFNTPPEMVVGIIAGGPLALTRSVEAVEDNAEAGRDDLAALQIGAGDCVVGIAASGRTPYVLGAVQFAARQGALTIGVSCNTGTELSELVDIIIQPVVGPEVLAGSTRLKAGTAEKMVLNMLSTGTMVLLGKTFGNLMVDLRASNTKLRERSIRILQAAAHLEEPEAQALLAACGGELKVAIVSALARVDGEEARRRLAHSEGIVQRAIEIDRPTSGERP
jgi:N-acetylmuramic acid 6-phosphate etherase